MAKMKVKPVKWSKGVTRVTWETKQTTRGPVTRLVPVRQETPARKISRSISSSTVNPQAGSGSSTPLCTRPHYQGSASTTSSLPPMAPKEPTRHQLSSRLQYQSRVPAFLQKFQNQVQGVADEDEDEPQYYDDGSGRPPIPVRPSIPERPSDDPGSAEEDDEDEKPQVVVLRAGKHLTEREVENERRKGSSLHLLVLHWAQAFVMQRKGSPLSLSVSNLVTSHRNRTNRSNPPRMSLQSPSKKHLVSHSHPRRQNQTRPPINSSDVLSQTEMIVAAKALKSRRRRRRSQSARARVCFRLERMFEDGPATHQQESSVTVCRLRFVSHLPF
jgi:hypothetical protein